jgi:anaerobic ribonucleoside-triphosphate reductase
LQANNEYVNATEKSTLKDKNVEITMEHSLHDSKQQVADETVSSPCSIICSEGESAPFQVSAEAIQATMKEIFMELDIDSKVCACTLVSKFSIDIIDIFYFSVALTLNKYHFSHV